MKLGNDASDALMSAIGSEQGAHVEAVVADDSVLGWSVFESNGSPVANEGVSETVTAVCSNILDLARKVAVELGESDPKPAITFSKSGKEMYTLPIGAANILVVRDSSSGFRKEFKNAR